METLTAMKILSVDQIREADQYTIKNEPIASEELMERASTVFVKWFCIKFSKKHPVKIFCGIGNNGGDGLAVARLLSARYYHVEVFIVRYSEKSSKDFQINEERLHSIKEVKMHEIREGDSFPESTEEDILVDALWGSGLSRPIEGFAAGLIQHLNDALGTRVAIDMPSGLYADSLSDSVKFKADYTLSFELPKLSFLLAENYPYVGEWDAKSIGLHQSFLEGAKTDNYYVTMDLVRSFTRKRKKFAHKGTYGHSLIAAGSYGKIGAAILSARGCLKAGAGLLTTYIPKCGYTAMQTNFPEAMTMTDEEDNFLSKIPDLDPYGVIGLGPGLGKHPKTAAFVKHMLESFDQPMVIDADALNIISENKEWLKLIPKNSILTPHPKEFERLFGKTENNYQEHERHKEVAKKYQLYIVLKGAHTAIACPDGDTYFNSTGNPGMATAGIGDVLTGVITGILSQGYDPKEAAILGVFLHGLAGDLAARKTSQSSLIASDLIQHLGKAFRKILN